jgi:hypothetical protein
MPGRRQPGSFVKMGGGQMLENRTTRPTGL